MYIPPRERPEQGAELVQLEGPELAPLAERGHGREGLARRHMYIYIYMYRERDIINTCIHIVCVYVYIYIYIYTHTYTRISG